MDEIVSITNNLGMSVTCSTVGAGLVDIKVPDKDGKIESVLVRPAKYSQYYHAKGSFGKPCGRTAGRISPKTFTIDGKSYTIETGNDKTFALHGGKEGYSDKTFDYKREVADDHYSLIFTYLSKDGEGGYPGNLKVTITYTIFNDQYRLLIHYGATTDKPTLCNITCHAYFNMSGEAKRNILNQVMFINASKVGEVNENTVAIKLNPVDKAFDFRKPHKIGDYIELPEVQKYTLGYDIPYALDKQGKDVLQASVWDEESGRLLEIYTSYDAVVCYSSNHPSEYIIQNGNELGKYDGICLEMQYFPNSINSPFIKEKKDILRPGKDYDNFIEYRFSIKK
ncbi:MAG: galactose mutarotase [Bacilli bacterium]|jgi:aldose 1-epimerase|nr:galactose mutarotase [Bacilli bacterium]